MSEHEEVFADIDQLVLIIDQSTADKSASLRNIPNQDR